LSLVSHLVRKQAHKIKKTTNMKFIAPALVALLAAPVAIALDFGGSVRGGAMEMAQRERELGSPSYTHSSYSTSSKGSSSSSKGSKGSSSGSKGSKGSSSGSKGSKGSKGKGKVSHCFANSAV
jgi:uncharacterized membrane protein YgcG